MIESKALDVYDAACLAGGPNRVVDTALTALLETGRVRAQRTGELSMVTAARHDEVEAAVLDAVGTKGWRTAWMVRQRAGDDERIARIADRLVRDGLVAAGPVARRLGRHSRSLALTPAGRRALRELRAELPVRGVAPGSSAARVAVRGTGEMPDAELRTAAFGLPPRAPRTRRRDRSHYYAGGATATFGGCGAGSTGGYGGGHGGGSCGGGSCGGGCGGGGG